MNYNLIHIEISKIDSDRVFDYLIYKKHYALNKNSNTFLGDHNENFKGRRCLNSYINENAFLSHKAKCGEYDICTIRNSSESHLHWKDHFQKNPLQFRNIAYFGTNIEIDSSSICIKTTIIYKQNPMSKGYYILS